MALSQSDVKIHLLHIIFYLLDYFVEMYIVQITTIPFFLDYRGQLFHIFHHFLERLDVLDRHSIFVNWFTCLDIALQLQKLVLPKLRTSIFLVYYGLCFYSLCALSEL